MEKDPTGIRKFFNKKLARKISIVITVIAIIVGVIFIPILNNLPKFQGSIIVVFLIFSVPIIMFFWFFSLPEK